MSRARPLASAALLIAGLAALTAPPPSRPAVPVPLPVPAPPAGGDTRALFRAYCGSCHSLQIAVAQRLDRSNWDWVLDDMIEKYGARFITPEERTALLDYLVEHHGPPPRRAGRR